MSTRRVFVDPSHFRGGEIVFPADTARYLHKVLRLKTGDRVAVFDGSIERLAVLTSVSGREVRARVQAPVGAPADKHLPLTLAFACVRPDPMSQILRHGTELGVSRFIPVLTARSNRRPESKKDRWETVIRSAAAQSGRVDCPEVLEPVTFPDLMALESESHVRLVLSTREDTSPILQVLEDGQPEGILALVGPEGGLDPAEEAAAAASGFIPVSLGRATLRTETAACVAAGIVFAWKDWRVR